MTTQEFFYLGRLDVVVAPSGLLYQVISNAHSADGSLEVESCKSRRRKHLDAPTAATWGIRSCRLLPSVPSVHLR